MKKVLLPSIILIALAVLMATLGGCNESSTFTTVPPTPAPTPTPTPAPAPTPTPSNAINAFAFLRADTTGTTSATAQQRQGVRRAAKLAHTSLEQAPITTATGVVNLYLWPGWIDKAGYWNLGTEQKITSTPGAYSSVHLSHNGTSIVYSEVVNGYNQIFTATVPAKATAMESPMQLTGDMEHHWLPNISPDGSKIVFTRFDPTSKGDVLCLIDNAAGASEKCLDLSGTVPVLRAANLWHASWGPNGSIYFEAWGSPLPSDEIFRMQEDGSGLKQVTSNLGTANYDECPSVSSDGAGLTVDTWSSESQHYQISWMDLTTGERGSLTAHLAGDAWDPLFNPYTLVWVSGANTEQSQELWVMSFSPIQLTHNNYADYFESSVRP